MYFKRLTPTGQHLHLGREYLTPYKNTDARRRNARVFQDKSFKKNRSAPFYIL